MDLTQISLFAGALIVLPGLMAIIQSAVSIPVRIVLPIYLLMSVLWGVVLYFSGQISFNLAAFVIQSIVTAFGAAGVHQQLPTFVPATSALLGSGSGGTQPGTLPASNTGTSDGTSISTPPTTPTV